MNAPREFSGVERRGNGGGVEEADRGKHEEYRRHLSQETGRASDFPSLVRGPSGTAGRQRVGMEEKKQFLCGVVEGKTGPLLDHVDITIIIIIIIDFWGEGLNTPVIDLYIAERHFCRWGGGGTWECCVFELVKTK